MHFTLQGVRANKRIAWLCLYCLFGGGTEEGLVLRNTTFSTSLKHLERAGASA